MQKRPGSFKQYFTCLGPFFSYQSFIFITLVGCGFSSADNVSTNALIVNSFVL